ncbi:MAG: hypothetical protein KAT79_03315, partial [candidate division Zixibacteria bacterium]|nr:hypothetical protein [candidate division Zixibacteria bacterium]
EEIIKVEQIVNDKILQSIDVETEVTDIESARASGATALFGEKYGDTVRVVSVGDFSKELCGGTHVSNTSQIGPFVVTLETGVASGVRRIEAITGRVAVAAMIDNKSFRQQASRIAGRPEEDALEGLQALRESNLALQKEIKKVKAEMFSGGQQTVGEEEKAGQIRFISNDFGETDRDTMGSWINHQKESNDYIFSTALGTINGNVTLMSGSTAGAMSDFGVDVGSIYKTTLVHFDGRGGGKSSFAQGTIPREADLKKLLCELKEELEKLQKERQ